MELNLHAAHVQRRTSLLLVAQTVLLSHGISLCFQQVIERLTERRIVVEKAVSTLGEAPQGLRDVFELCRGFEKAFSNIVNVGGQR